MIFTLRASRSKLTEAVFTVRVDELTGYRQTHPIRDVLHCLDWRWSGGFPEQQVIINPGRKKEHMVAGTHENMNMKFEDVDLEDKAVIFFMHE